MNQEKIIEKVKSAQKEVVGSRQKEKKVNSINKDDKKRQKTTGDKTLRRSKMCEITLI